MSQLLLKLKKNTVAQIALVILGVLCLGDMAPVGFKAGALALSLSLKEILTFVVPVILLGSIFDSILQQRNQAFLFLCAMLGSVYLSNFLTTCLGYGVGSEAAAHFNFAVNDGQRVALELKPLWSIQLVNPLSTRLAIAIALVTGLWFAKFPHPLAQRASVYLNRLIYGFLQRFFIPVLPLFVLGFVLKMQYEGVLSLVLMKYLPLLWIIALTSSLCLLTYFALAARFSWRRALQYIKPNLAAGLVGFTTMSSLAALPLMIKGSEQNLNEEDASFVRTLLPVTANMHMIGSSIIFQVLVLAVMSTYGHNVPTFAQFLPFAQLFVMARFTVAGVPSASMLVMMPALSSQLGFTDEMIAFLSAVYVLFNPLVTFSNILGNGAFVILLHKLFKRLFTRKPVTDVAV